MSAVAAGRRAALLLLSVLIAGASPRTARSGETATADTDRRLLGWTITAGSYAVMGTYAFYTWYENEEQRDFFVAREGWFGRETYAGGADKLGHCFASYVITRAGHDVLSWAGLSRKKALTAAVALDTLFFTAIEVKDGYTRNLGFSWGDIAANLGGSALAAAFVLEPSLDRAFDFRLEYYPSREYLEAIRREGSLNAVEDYTGMTFGLWYHLGAVPGLKERPVSAWLRFVDVGVTYSARHYRPKPDTPRPTQRVFSAAVSLNFAALVRALADGRAPTVVRATDWAFEYFTPPGTTLKLP